MADVDKQAYELVDALLRIHYHCLAPSKACLEKLKKTKHITAKGDRLTKAGSNLLDRWFDRGADRMKIGKEFK